MSPFAELFLNKHKHDKYNYMYLLSIPQRWYKTQTAEIYSQGNKNELETVSI